jgi:hypothetical protein
MKYNRQMPSNTTHMKTHVNSQMKSQMNTHKTTKNGHRHNHGNVYGHENGHEDGNGHGHGNGVDTDNCVLNQQCLHMLTELMSEVKSLRGEVGHLKSLLTPSTRNSHFSSHSSCKIKILEHESHTYGSETEGYEDDGNEGSVENEDDANEGSVENEDDENDGGDEDESDDLVLSDTGNEGTEGAVEVQYNSNDYTFDKFMTHVSFCNQSQLMDVFESEDIIESFFYLWNETVTTFYAKNDHCLPLKYNSQQNMMYHYIAPQMNENTNTNANTIMNSNMHTTPSWECMTYNEIQRMVKYLVSKIMGELKVYQTTHRSAIDSNITFRDKYMDHVHIVSTASEKLIQHFKKNPGQFIRLLGANIR